MEQPSKYEIALEVLDELLPRASSTDHTSLGSPFDSGLQRLSAQIDAVRSDMLHYLRRVAQKLPDTSRGHALDELSKLVDCDMAETLAVLKHFSANIEKLREEREALVKGSQRPLSDEVNDSIVASLKAEGQMMETETLVRECFVQFQSIHVRLSATILPVLAANISTSHTALTEMHSLLHLFNRLKRVGMVARMQPRLAKVLMENLPLTAGEVAAEEFALGIATIIPYATFLLHTLKAFRGEQVKAEEAIHVVDLLICTREIIHIWNEGAFKSMLALEDGGAPEVDANLVSEFQQIVTASHESWNRLRTSLAPWS